MDTLEIICDRCGIEYAIRRNTYEYRVFRGQPNARHCPDCFERVSVIKPEEYWDFVKTELGIE